MALSWNEPVNLYPYAVQVRPFPVIQRHQDKWRRTILPVRFASEWCIEFLGIAWSREQRRTKDAVPTRELKLSAQ